MEEIKDYAIILIYPDGEVEKIPITTYKNHFDCLKEHSKKSKKLASIFYRIIIGKDMHYNMSRLLAMHGVIEIANKDMCIKIENALYYEKFSPEFYFFYPTRLGSLEQMTALENIEQKIPKDKIICYEYSDAIFNFNKKLVLEYKIWKEENKNRLESEIHKL